MKFRVQSLIARIVEQRDAHKRIFDTAVEVYRKELLQHVEAYVTRIKKGELVFILHELPVPEEHTKDFDLLIDMLGCTADEMIELSKSEFDCYVRGNWGWKASFDSNTTSYANKVK